MFDEWERIKARGPGWFWLAGSLRNGDIYHVCSLAEAFADHYGRAYPIFLVVSRRFQADLASLFRDQFAAILIEPDLPDTMDGWRPFFAQSERPRFARDMPLLLHPQFYDWGRFSIEFAHDARLTWMNIYKKMLQLPGETEPSFPTIKPDFVERAREICVAANMPRGRSVILFPYAQSLPVHTPDHFARLARDLTSEGYSVFTSVADEEAPIDGTRGVFLPFNLLIDVAEYAGWVVAIRSGICDITSSARCRKTYIYPETGALVAWSVSAMGLSRDAKEITFNFVWDTPESFSAMVRTGADLAIWSAPPHRMTTLIGQTHRAETILALSCEDLQADLPSFSAEQTGSLPALVVTNIPPRHHPRKRAETADLAGRLASLTSGLRFYSCRDTTPFDFFEEIDETSLRTGQYHAARSWHSLVVVPDRFGQGLADVLPLQARPAILAIDRIATDAPIHFGSFFGSAAYGQAITRPVPVSLGGVQFLEGWSGLEPWGLWTNALRASLKLALPNPVSPGTRLALEVKGCISASFPNIGLAIAVNGRSAGRFTIDSAALTVLTIEIDGAATPTGVFTITFLLDDARSPLEQAGHPDDRRLGLGIASLTIRDTSEAGAGEQP